MNEDMKTNLQNHCHKIRLFIGGVWRFFLILIILGWFGVFLIATHPSPEDFRLESASVGEETVYIVSALGETYINIFGPKFNETAMGKAQFVLVLWFICQLLGYTIFLQMLGCLRWIFIHISDGSSPFTNENSRLIRKAGLFTMIYGMIISLLFPVLCVIFGLSSFYFEFEALMVAVLLGAVIVALSYIFEYGTVLQQESDELL